MTVKFANENKIVAFLCGRRYNIPMKTFRYKFTKLTLIFIWIGLALSAAAFGATLFSVLSGDYKTYANITLPALSYAIMFFISVMLAVILVSLLISSYYAVGKGCLKTSFGIIKSKFKTDEIEGVILDRQTNKLSVRFQNGTFIMITVNPDWYEDFIAELIKSNPRIDYSINSKINGPDDKPGN